MVIYELDRRNGSMPSAALLGYQKFRASDKGTPISTISPSPSVNPPHAQQPYVRHANQASLSSAIRYTWSYELRIRPPFPFIRRYLSYLSQCSYVIYLLNVNLTSIFCFPYSDSVEELIRPIFGDGRVCIYQLSVVYIRVDKIVY